MVKDIPAVNQKSLPCSDKGHSTEAGMDKPDCQKMLQGPHQTPHQNGTRMSITRSAWEPCWGPVFKNKEHFVEMHLC